MLIKVTTLKFIFFCREVEVYHEIGINVQEVAGLTDEPRKGLTEANVLNDE